MWWPRCALLGCAALKKNHLSSRQRVPRRALRKEPRDDLFLWFLNENEFEVRDELTWHVYFEADQLAGPVVALVEQNAIELDLRNVCRRTGCKVTFRAVGWRVRQRDCEYRGVNDPFEKVVSMYFLKVKSIRVQEQSR